MSKTAHSKYPNDQRGIPQDPRPGAAGRPFNPMGTGYDYESARRASIKPDKTGHWASRNEKTGQILKGRGHPTWHKTVEGEAKQGYEIYKKGGRYYSRPDYEKRKKGLKLGTGNHPLNR
jgi:hypothetical protein